MEEIDPDQLVDAIKVDKPVARVQQGSNTKYFFPMKHSPV